MKIFRYILKWFIILAIIYILLCTFPFFNMPFEAYLHSIWVGIKTVIGTIYQLIKPQGY